MARKIIKKFVVGNQEVRVYRDSEWNEYIVRLFVDGKPEPGDGYFDPDKESAISTAEHIASQIPGYGANADSEAAKLAESILRHEGVRSDVVRLYDDAQTRATKRETYRDFKKEGHEDKAETYAHNHAIDRVRELLLNLHLITPAASKQVVSLAFSMIT